MVVVGRFLKVWWWWVRESACCVEVPIKIIDDRTEVFFQKDVGGKTSLHKTTLYGLLAQLCLDGHPRVLINMHKHVRNESASTSGVERCLFCTGIHVSSSGIVTGMGRGFVVRDVPMGVVGSVMAKLCCGALWVALSWEVWGGEQVHDRSASRDVLVLGAQAQCWGHLHCLLSVWCCGTHGSAFSVFGGLGNVVKEGKG